MLSSRSTTGLVFGLAAVGITLAAAGARVLRRRVRARPAPGVEVIETRSGLNLDQPALAIQPLDQLETQAPDGSPQTTSQLPLDFFALVVLMTIPFWVLGGRPLPVPMKLPFSALAIFNPLLAAAILTYRRSGSQGVRRLFRRSFDYKKIRPRIWYLPVLFYYPAIAVLSYAVLRWTGQPLPEPEIPWASLLVLFPLFFVAGIGEELGWMGYAIDPLQKRWGALLAAIGLGVFWGLFHLIPDLQNNQAADWILWQRLSGIAFRILMVWVYNNTAGSVLTAILFHVTNNLSWSLFPNNGSHYSPFLTLLFSLPMVVYAIVGWGAQTLAEKRSARKG